MKNLYDEIGEEKLNLVVQNFYNRVYSSPILKPLFQVDRTSIQEKQMMFLTQFLGGPKLYSQKYGQPNMKKKHIPHPIDVRAKEEWLFCMKTAIDSIFKENQALGERFYAVFPKIAKHLVNQ